MEESIRNYKLLSEDKKEQMMVGFAPEIIHFRVWKINNCGNSKLPEPIRYKISPYNIGHILWPILKIYNMDNLNRITITITDSGETSFDFDWHDNWTQLWWSHPTQSWEVWISALMVFIVLHIIFIKNFLSGDGTSDHTSFEAIRLELTKRIFLFLGLPALILFGSILWLAVDWPGFFSAWLTSRFHLRAKRSKGAILNQSSVK